MNKLNKQVALLFHEQVSNWELARVNYNGLKTVRTKTFTFDNVQVSVQFNPARIVSSGAKMDARSIAERKCFLCAANLPAEQKCIDAGNYTILVNPFPIFPQHFTIPRKEHIDQLIKPYFAEMLELAEALDEYVVFYNGPRCGASAPDHMHFQAGNREFLPLIADYKKLKPGHSELIETGANYQLYKLKDYLRTVYCIESDTISSAEIAFDKLYTAWEDRNGKGIEPMMNIVCSFENNKWEIFIFPRKAFRPWQYTAEEDKRLMISPATIEMSGILITPIESHFDRITQNDVLSILDQCSEQE
jgi:ATP adenylyltransferase/5',5'''-P-1,P-4-tetraphosphate phosphorylase II